MTNIKILSLGRIKLIFLLFFLVGKLSIGFSQCDCADLSTSNLCNGGYFADHATCASSTDPNQGGTANPYNPPTPLPWNTVGSTYTFCVKYTIPAGVTKIGFMNFVNTRKTPSGNCGGAFSRGNWSAYASGCSNPIIGTPVVGDPNSNEFDVTANTEYRFCVTVTLNGTCSDITGIENYLYNATPAGTSCSSSIGTVTVTGATANSSEWDLNPGGTLDLTASGFVLPADGGTSTCTASYGYMVFDQAPVLPITDITKINNTDMPGYKGISPGATCNDNNNAGKSSSVTTANKLWYVPITIDCKKGTDNKIHIDDNGDNCYAIGTTAIIVNYLSSSSSCGTCTAPTCPISSTEDVSSSSASLKLSHILDSIANIGANDPMAYNGNKASNLTYTNYYKITITSARQLLGMKQKLSAIPSGDCATRTYTLVSSCSGTPITPTTLNANNVSSGMNPEWYNLPVGDYILSITTTSPDATCEIDFSVTGYYLVNIPCPLDQSFIDLDWNQGNPFVPYPTTTYTCASGPQKIWKDVEEAEISNGGQLSAVPGFFMELITDANSDTETSATVTVNGTDYSYYGPNGTAPAGVLDWGPMAITPDYQNIIEPYLTAGASVSIKLCDKRTTAQSFKYKVYDLATGNLLKNGIATPSASNCTTITFTISAPTMSWKIDGSTANITDNNNGSATFNPANLSTGNHSIVYTYDNGAGCTLSSTQTIDVNTTKVNPTTSPVSYCQNETTSPLSVTATTGNTLNWYGTNATGGTSSSTAPTPNSTNVGQTTYYVSQTNTSSSCESPRIPLVVTIKSSPTISISSTPSQICIDESASLTATGASTYSWDSDMATAFSTSNPVTVSPTITTNYTVTGTLNGCTSSATYSLTVNSAPIIVFDDTLAICEPESINLADTKYRIGSTAGSQFKFYTNSGLTNILMGENAVSSSGKYYIQSTLNGCKSKKDSVVVVIEKKPVVDYKITPKTITTLNPEAKLINESAGAVSYNWNFGDGTTSNLLSPKHMFVCNDTASFLVKLTGSTKFGCSDSILKTVKIIEEIVYFVPNTFTPDGDQFNQEFKPIFASGYDTKGYTMYIFNRWGQLIFQTNDITKGWDGKNISTGEFVQNGSYTWKIIFSIKNDDRNKEIVGKVNVLK